MDDKWDLGEWSHETGCELYERYHIEIKNMKPHETKTLHSMESLTMLLSILELCIVCLSVDIHAGKDCYGCEISVE